MQIQYTKNLIPMRFDLGTIVVVTHTLDLGPYGEGNGLGLVQLRFLITLGDAVAQ